jgi:succinoglycan biosynthesis transport protein ExoP
MSAMATEARTMPGSVHVAAVRQALREQRGKLPDFGPILWRRKLLILACLGVVLGLTAAYVSTFAPAYHAEALIALPDRPVLGEDAAIQDSTLEDQQRLIESRAMAERLVDRLELQLVAEFHPNVAGRGFRFASVLGRWLPDAILTRLPKAWADAFVPRPSDREMTDEQRAARLWEEVIAATMARIRADVRAPSAIVVKFISADRQLAAAGANALAELYLEGRGAVPQNASPGDRDRLGQEIERLRASIRATEQAIDAAVAGADAQDSAASERSSLELTDELAFWRGERAEVETRLRQTQATLESGGDLDQAALFFDAERLGQLQASATELQQVLGAVAQQFGEQDPQVVELRTQLAALEQERRAEIDHVLQRLRDEVAIIQSRETALEAKIDALGEEPAEGQAGGGLTVLEQRLEADRALLREYLEQAAGQLGAQPAAPFSDARIVTPAVVPDEPTYPHLALIWGAASAGGLLLGILLAFALEAWRHRRA